MLRSFSTFRIVLELSHPARITAVNDYALQTIEASKAPPSLLARVSLFSLSTNNPTNEAVIDTFLMSMDNIGSHMARLRDEAETSRGHLLRLEEHLMVLQEVTLRDNKDLTATKEDILAKLWTRLRNKDKLKKIDLDLDLLKNVDKYRGKALSHVVATLQTIDTLDADMEELRAKVAAPEIVGDRIPLEVHMESIKAGVERLKARQIRAGLRSEERIGKILETGV